jgi:hypothetical protein
VTGSTVVKATGRRQGPPAPLGASAVPPPRPVALSTAEPTPYSGFRCIRCGGCQPGDFTPAMDCCPQPFLIRVRVRVPAPAWRKETRV